VPGWRLPHRLASVQRVALFHFVTRSREDFRKKIARGGGASTTAKRMDFFNSWSMCAHHLLSQLAILTQFLLLTTIACASRSKDAQALRLVAVSKQPVSLSIISLECLFGQIFSY
jgi:hypothetical protein